MNAAERSARGALIVAAHLLALLAARVQAEEPIFVDGAKLKLEADNGSGGEGPAWSPTLGLLTSGEGHIYQLNREGRSRIYRERAGTNGLLFDARGRLLACEAGPRRVTRTELDGTITVLTDRYQGHRYNQPNDLSVDSQGRIYFSDPRYGNREGMELLDEQGRTVEGVYRIDVDGSVTRIISRELERPNGLLVSADDRFLFVADNNNSAAGGARKLWRFALRADGTVDFASRKLLYDWGEGRGPDGLKQDQQGRLYVAAGLNKPNPPFEPAEDKKGGIYVFDLEGKLLAFLSVPRDEVTNCAFGGDDLKTLYITAGGSLYSIRCSTPGRVVWPEGRTEDEAREIQQQLTDLDRKLSALRSEGGQKSEPSRADLIAGAEIFSKGVAWALRYETKLAPADVALLKRSLTLGHERADSLARDGAEGNGMPGRFACGYVSAVDGSTQPFGLIVPAGYDPQRPIRLDVVLHGSTRPVGLSELRFIDRFEKEGARAPSLAEQPFIELHPLGRVENCYRWAGETDVFEAIEAVCRQYNIDRDRIVLRGMSMGASGTWHLGLKHPDFFVALGPYCGYVDTHRFSQTPLPNFIKVGPLPERQERALHMLDSVDYAANVGIVPAIACMGEKDVFIEAHQIMAEAMRKEGLQLVNLISPGTGHVIDPVTHREQMRLIGAFAAGGIERSPRKLRFVTWTLKYSRCHWLRVLGLKKHYERAELAATLNDDGSIDVEEPKNITAFALSPPERWATQPRVRVAGKEVEPLAGGAKPGGPVVVALRDGRWVALGQTRGEVDGQDAEKSKRPGLQGPIDDAFTTAFLCVRGTGRPWNAAVQAWADANLRRFAYEWNRYFRGELPIKNDVDVTDEDRRRANLILFGDPGSNKLLREALPSLPIGWSESELETGDRRYAAAEHAPALICPSPWSSQTRYVVVNSGHTFHETELSSLNYLLFPRLGDWAVFKVGESQPEAPTAPLQEELLEAGYFDEAWRFPADADDRGATSR